MSIGKLLISEDLPVIAAFTKCSCSLFPSQLPLTFHLHYISDVYTLKGQIVPWHKACTALGHAIIQHDTLQLLAWLTKEWWQKRVTILRWNLPLKIKNHYNVQTICHWYLAHPSGSF